jgi:hypothetical protein
MVGEVGVVAVLRWWAAAFVLMWCEETVQKDGGLWVVVAVAVVGEVAALAIQVLLHGLRLTQFVLRVVAGVALTWR